MPINRTKLASFFIAFSMVTSTSSGQSVDFDLAHMYEKSRLLKARTASAEPYDVIGYENELAAFEKWMLEKFLDPTTHLSVRVQILSERPDVELLENLEQQLSPSHLREFLERLIQATHPFATVELFTLTKQRLNFEKKLLKLLLHYSNLSKFSNSELRNWFGCEYLLWTEDSLVDRFAKDQNEDLNKIIDNVQFEKVIQRSNVGNDKSTPLGYAVMGGSFKQVRSLIEAGADPQNSVLKKMNLPPLDLNAEQARFLLSKNAGYLISAEHAIERTNIEVLDLLDAAGLLNLNLLIYRSPCTWPALFSSKPEQTLNYLLSKGADINQLSASQHSLLDNVTFQGPLGRAVRQNAKLLLEMGARGTEKGLALARRFNDEYAIKIIESAELIRSESSVRNEKD